MATAKIKPCVKKSNAANQKITRALVGTAEAGRRSRRATRVMFRGAWKLPQPNFEKIFPRLGEMNTTDSVLKLLKEGRC
jgi:hypothetical protein